MANELSYNAEQVRPLKGSITQKAVADVAIYMGQPVRIDDDSEATLAQSDSAAHLAGLLGVAAGMQPPGHTDGQADIGEMIDYVTHGPVFLGEDCTMTEGQPVYVSATSGRLTQTKPATVWRYIGQARSANVLYVESDPRGAVSEVD